MTDSPFQLTMDVRDYECDMQGIVNNGVYQNYLEHARHEYLKSLGVDFADYTRRGIHLVVIRAELDYRRPLTSGDRFAVTVRLCRESRARFAFYQQIRHLTDEKVMLDAKIVGTAMNDRGRPQIPEELARLLEQAPAE